MPTQSSPFSLSVAHTLQEVLPTLQTHQDPILLLPWLCSSSFPNPNSATSAAGRCSAIDGRWAGGASCWRR
jgi:hypothetical protein